MGYYVHIHVVFNCSENEGVAKIAKKHLDSFSGGTEARTFLEDLSKRTGFNPGPKGGLSLWGIVGNYTNAAEFAESLSPFWLDLLSDSYEGGPLCFEHVLVFEEGERAGHASAFEIGMDECYEALTIKKHELPFSFTGVF